MNMTSKCHNLVTIVEGSQWCSQNAKKLRTSKGDYWNKQWFSLTAILFKIGTSLQGKNLLPEGANSFL